MTEDAHIVDTLIVKRQNSGAVNVYFCVPIEGDEIWAYCSFTECAFNEFVDSLNLIRERIQEKVIVQKFNPLQIEGMA